MALNEFTADEMNDEVGSLLEESYLSSPDAETLTMLADLYEVSEEQVWAVLKLRNIEEKAEEARQAHNRKHFADVKSATKSVNVTMTIIIGLFVLMLVSFAYCALTTPTSQTSKIEQGAQILCDAARGGCK